MRKAEAREGECESYKKGTVLYGASLIHYCNKGYAVTASTWCITGWNLRLK